MNKKNAILAALAASIFAFSGCSTVELHATIATADLTHGVNKSIAGELEVEVPSCTAVLKGKDGGEKTIEDEYVDMARASVSKSFPSAKFRKCERKNRKYLAAFELPIELNPTQQSEDKVSMYKTKENLLELRIPEKAIDEARYSADRFLPDLKENFKITITLFNNERNPLKTFAYSSLVDGEPKVFGEITLPPQGSTEITLSKISFLQIMERQSVPVLK